MTDFINFQMKKTSMMVKLLLQTFLQDLVVHFQNFKPPAFFKENCFQNPAVPYLYPLTQYWEGGWAIEKANALQTLVSRTVRVGVFNFHSKRPI